MGWLVLECLRRLTSRSLDEVSPLVMVWVVDIVVEMWEGFDVCGWLCQCLSTFNR